MHAAIDPQARSEVMARLEAIERQHDVRILLAVESGSRAWGFHSPDSDYDARFIFVRRLDAYLSLTPPRDVIETPIEGLFDVNGWDLSKALKLMMRGNSVVQEWLASPVVYRKDDAFLAGLEPLSRAWRSVYADTHHYLGLLSTQRARFIEGRETINLKKYFYVVRPAVALQWLRERGGSPPMDLPGLLAGVTLPAPAAAALDSLREAKARASELGSGARIPDLDAYVAEQADWAMASKPRAPKPDAALVARTSAFFRAVVKGEIS